MEEITLTPEQLFFLGTLMDAAYINYEYIAALGELQRNYSRIRRSCLDQLTQAGLIRQRLSGEISLRPSLQRLLENVFFGEAEAVLEIFTPEEQKKTALHFHRGPEGITLVTTEGSCLTLLPSSPEHMAQTVDRLMGGTEQPPAATGIRKEAVTRILAAKQAAPGRESTGLLLFEQFGGWYGAAGTALPDTQARQAVLNQLKGA